MWAGEEEKSGVLDVDGVEVIALGRFQIHRTSEIGVAVVEVQGLEGLVDEDGDWIIEPQAERARVFTSPELDRVGGPFYQLENSDEQHSNCEIRRVKTGERVNDVELTSCYEIEAPLFAVGTVNSGNLKGFMNTNWEMEIPAQFEFGGYFRDGLAKVRVTEAYAEALCASDAPLENEHIRAACQEFDNSRAYGWGFINRQGQLISRFDYQQVSSYSSGRARVRRYDDSGSYLYGYIDETGVEVIPPQYIWATDFSEGYAVVDATGEGGHAKIIDLEGNYFINGICTAEPFSEGLAFVAYSCSPTKQAYINTSGEIVIPDLGDGPFLAGHAWVYDIKARNYGLIDKKANWVLPYRLTEEPKRQSDGLSRFEIPQETEEWKYREGWINPDGKIIWPPDWNDPCHENDVIVWPEGSCEK